MKKNQKDRYLRGKKSIFDDFGLEKYKSVNLLSRAGFAGNQTRSQKNIIFFFDKYFIDEIFFSREILFKIFFFNFEKIIFK